MQIILSLAQIAIIKLALKEHGFASSLCHDEAQELIGMFEGVQDNPDTEIINDFTS